MTLAALVSRRSVEDSTRPLTDAAIVEWLGGQGRTAAGVRVTEQRVLGLTAYLRAIALTAGVLAATPLHVYRKGTRERVRQATVLDAPNPRQTPFEFWQTMLANALSWGTAYGLVVRNAAGMPAQVWPWHPSTVRVDEVDPTEANPEGLVFRRRDPSTGVERLYGPGDVFRLPYLSPTGVAGLSPLQACVASLGAAVAAEDLAGKFYANGQHLSGLLLSAKSLNDEAANRLTRRWHERFAGVSKAGQVAVLDGGAEFKPLTIPPVDAQLLESRRFGISEVARMFGCPPHLLADVERSTSWGSGIGEQALGWVKFTLQSWVTLIEQRVTWQLLPGGRTAGAWWAEYKLEGLLRGDSKARAEFYRHGILDGWMTRADARELENLDPIDGLEVPYVPTNMRLVGEGDALDVGELFRYLQQVYLAVGKVITAAEARALLIAAGADLSPDTPPELTGGN